MALSDNSRYRDLKVADGTYVPDIGMDYPEDDPDARLVPTTKVRDIKFDDTYPYYDNSFSYKVQRFIVSYIVAYGPVFLMNKFGFGMKIEGREILRKYRKEFKKGIVSVSNHCYPYDGNAIAIALGHKLWIPMLSDHFNGKDWWLLTHYGGIPLPDGSFSAQKKFNEAFDKRHEEGGWIHVFPEARNWLFYKPLRPFRKGAFTMAYKYDAPVLPMCITYRERTGIYKWFGKAEHPLVTVKIGEPIFPDTTQPRKAEVERLQNEAHAAVCALGGIIENTWPASWNENKSSNL